ncbi:hypothetical protein [Clostridium cellulovorans]|uniref:Uncharacterized protein n=1 Tax=Clostridium cellulovorans (strain ATCC 35296 / DSM 3052 / OCM 3 / 743B) TaxID=573061 RepID=D9SMJ0_CLOC7|nr:hypothetical protein [Clostridium cellulovorans]ADL53846.1 hypothetical protein Clocel_4185 [Clostridium cellulovorans 743B]
MIEIERKSEIRDKMRSYKIILDNKFFGEIKSGEIKRFNIATGKHRIYLKIDWCRSNKLDFYISNDEVVELKCGNSMKQWTIVNFLAYATIAKNKYLWIDIKKIK